METKSLNPQCYLFHKLPKPVIFLILGELSVMVMEEKKLFDWLNDPIVELNYPDIPSNNADPKKVDKKCILF